MLSSLLDLASSERVSLSIAHATAPVFLLSAVATLINALHARSARLVDHARLVLAGSGDAASKNARVALLKFRYARIRRAMVLAVWSGLMTILMVTSMFVTAYLGLAHMLGAGVLFFASLVLFGIALVELARELISRHDEFDEEVR